VHRGDQLFFVFVKYGAPLVVRFQVDEIFGVAESSRVGSIIGTAYFRDHRLNFGKRSEYIAAVSGELLAFRKTRAIGQSAARPDGAFVEVGQELRANHA